MVWLILLDGGPYLKSQNLKKYSHEKFCKFKATANMVLLTSYVFCVVFELNYCSLSFFHRWHFFVFESDEPGDAYDEPEIKICILTVNGVTWSTDGQ